MSSDDNDISNLKFYDELIKNYDLSEENLKTIHFSDLVCMIQMYINKSHEFKDDFTQENKENLLKLLSLYAEKGGDIAYFINGAGAPGNCCIC